MVDDLRNGMVDLVVGAYADVSGTLSIHNSNQDITYYYRSPGTLPLSPEAAKLRIVVHVLREARYDYQKAVSTTFHHYL